MTSREPNTMPPNAADEAPPHEAAQDPLTYAELRGIMDGFGLAGQTPVERAEELRAMDEEGLAWFLATINARVWGRHETRFSQADVMMVGTDDGPVPTIPRDSRHETFTQMVAMLKEASPDVSPARLGDALALCIVTLHAFGDDENDGGNGRTARLVGFMFREVFDDPSRAEQEFTKMVTSQAHHADGSPVVTYKPFNLTGMAGFIPGLVLNYIDRLLSSDESGLYDGPYGQAPLR